MQLCGSGEGQRFVPRERLGGMIASGPGLGGGTNYIWERVLKTARSTVRKRRPKRSLPRCDCTDPALVLRNKWTGQMVSYVGLSMIRAMVRCGKLPTILSMDGMVVLDP